MPYFPNDALLPDLLIHPFSVYSIGSELASSVIGTPVSAAWPTASKAYYYPIYLPQRGLVTKLWWMNGATVSGNVDCGLYRYTDLTKVVTAGTTAQATINVLQNVDITDVMVEAGTYYAALALDNITGTIFRSQNSSPDRCKTAGLAQQTTAFVLPTSATLAVPSTSDVWMFGIAYRTLVA